MPSFNLVLTSLFHTFAGTSVWSQLSLLNMVEMHVRDFINSSLAARQVEADESKITWIWSLLVSSWLWGALFGSVILEPCVERFGRRLSVGVYKNILIILGSLLQFAAKHMQWLECLIFGRFLCGIASPFSAYLSVFMSECAPTNSRGLVSSLPTFGLRLWAALGLIAGLPYLLGTAALWHYMFLPPALASLIHICGTRFYPESPKYLFISKDDQAAAQISIRFYHGEATDVEQVMLDLNREKELREAQTSISLKEILTKKHLFWPVVLSVLLIITDPLVGADIVSQYSTGILTVQLGPETAANITVFAIQLPLVLISLLGTFLVTRFPRKPLFLVGFGLEIVGAYTIAWSSNAILTACVMVLMMWADTVTPCLIRYFMPGELCPTPVRAIAFSLGSVAQNVHSGLSTLFFPPLEEAIGKSVWLFFAFPSTACFVFIWHYLPETRNRTVNEIAQEWLSEEIVPLLEIRSNHNGSESDLSDEQSAILD